MNHAAWQSRIADRRKTDVAINESKSFNPDKTPEITKKLLALDEQQLDLLTGQRADIFNSNDAARHNTQPENTTGGRVETLNFDS